MTIVFIDANIPMYAGGKEHPLKAPSQAILRAVADGEFVAFTDAEVLQEIWHRYWHIREADKHFDLFPEIQRIDPSTIT